MTSELAAKKQRRGEVALYAHVAARIVLGPVQPVPKDHYLPVDEEAGGVDGAEWRRPRFRDVSNIAHQTLLGLVVPVAGNLVRPVQATLHLDPVAVVAGRLVNKAAGFLDREPLFRALNAAIPFKLQGDVCVEALMDGLPELELQLAAGPQPVLESEIAEYIVGPDAVPPRHVGPVLRLELRADVHDQVPVVEQFCFRVPAALSAGHALHALDVFHQLVSFRGHQKLGEALVQVAADLLSRNQRWRPFSYPPEYRFLVVDPP